jgi:hypothetical protein
MALNIQSGRFAVAKRHPECHTGTMDARDKGTPGAITPAQVRAARGLLGWPLDQLIAASGVPKRTMIRFEGSTGVPRASTVSAVRAALEAAGVEFIAEDGGGPGVRLRKGR